MTTKVFLSVEIELEFVFIKVPFFNRIKYGNFGYVYEHENSREFFFDRRYVLNEHASYAFNLAVSLFKKT